MKSENSHNLERSPALLLKAEEVGKLLGIHRASVWAKSEKGEIPSPVRFGRCTRWRRQEILDWIEVGCPTMKKWGKIN